MRLASLALAWTLLAAAGAPADPLEVTDLGGGVHMLAGRGGNIGLSVGPDGAFLVDDQFAPAHPDILAAVRARTPLPVRFVVNTHWHGDHTGGNEELGKLGSIIVAHDNVRRRLSTDQFSAFKQKTYPARPAKALPVVTFPDEVTFHWNGQEIRVRHVDPAHTDGDAFVHFVGADVIHTGDLFFHGFYPFIDWGSGGSIGGMIRAADRVLAVAGPRTRIIPGHGPLATRADLVAYRDMLRSVEETLTGMLANGMSDAAIVAAKPTRAHDPKWGGGFLPPDKWVQIVLNGMRGK